MYMMHYSNRINMKLLVLCCCLAVAVTAAPGRDYIEHARGGRIIGGIDALPHEFPSVVSLQRLILTISTHVCGGTILNERWAMTAGHCILNSPEGARFAIWAGSHALGASEPTRQVINVADSIIHPEYLGGVNPSDIALLRLENLLNFNEFVRPSVLPAQGDYPIPGPATLAGWGSTSASVQIMPTVLQKVQKPIIDFDTCEEANGGPGNTPLGPTNVCTGPLTGGISACAGDSGSPLLVIENGVQTQVGIVSWGWVPCGTIGRPSVYVGVASYRSWIDSEIN